MNVEVIVARYGLAALFLGAGLEGEATVIAGGLLAHEGLLSLPGAMAAAVLGSFAADQAFFASGRRFRDHRWVRRAQARPAFARALRFLERHPTGFIFAFRFLYGLRTVSPVAIGTSAVPTRSFVWLNAVAAAIWGVLFTSLGYVFGSGLADLFGRYRPHGRDLLMIVGGIVALMLVIALVRRWRAGDDAR